jgi:uncharacterized protein (DUF2141 family)
MRKRKRYFSLGLFIITIAIAIFAFATSYVVQKYRTFNFSFAAGLIGDVDGNGIVNIVDIGLIIDNYGKTPPPNPKTDIDGNGTVNIVDIGIVIDHYGQTGSSSTPTPSPTSGSGSGSLQTYAQVNAAVDAYKAAHPGNGGKDWDINAKDPATLAADSAATALASICGPGQRPVIPKIAWEYGGADHPWINPGASALVYCVYVPTTSASSHWKYDAATDRVTADVYVKFPSQNPCNNLSGNAQVLSCLGDPTNSEIIVDTVSLNDGIWAGTPNLQNASTSLNLIMPNGSSVFLLLGL